MTKIKLCGLTRPEDIRAANALMPDYVGFVVRARQPSVRHARACGGAESVAHPLHNRGWACS